MMLVRNPGYFLMSMMAFTFSAGSILNLHQTLTHDVLNKRNLRIPRNRNSVFIVMLWDC